MRRIIATTLFLTGATASLATAQVSVGVRGGLSFARLVGGADTEARTRLIIGGFGAAYVTHSFHIQAEVSYTQKGAKTESAIFDPVQGPVRLEKLTTLDYVELQLPAGFTIRVTDERARPRIYFGPTFALALRCRVNVNVEPGTSPPPEDCADDTKSFDFGLVAGIGIEYGKGPGAFIADVRYDVGLANVSDLPDEPAVKNRSFQIVLGYVRRL